MRDFTKWGKSHDEIRKKLNPDTAPQNSLPVLPTDILSWIEQARPIVDNKKRSFLICPFWIEIYKNTSPQKMIIGSRQIFKSTYVTDILACDATSHPGIQVCYVTYDDKNLNGFSKQRLRVGTFLQNEILAQFIRKNQGSVSEIPLKNDSTIYCITDTNEYRNVEGKSLYHVVLDEAQYQDISHIEKITQTLMQTKGSITILGLGGISGTAYEKQWLETDQREWTYDDPNWRDKLQFDDNGLIIADYLKDVLKGKWIAQKPENKYFPGYRISQEMFPNIPLTISDAVEKYHVLHKASIQYQKENSPRDIFITHTKGEFYKAASNPLTPEMIRNRMIPFRDKKLLSAKEIAAIKEQYGEKVKISMGVDFGSGNGTSGDDSGYTVITILIKWLDKNLIQLAYLDKREPENQLNQAEYINELFRNSRCDVGIGDLGYGTIQVKVIQDGAISQTTGERFPEIHSSVFLGSRMKPNATRPFSVNYRVNDEHGETASCAYMDSTHWVLRLVELFDSENIMKFMIPFSPDTEDNVNWLIPSLSRIERKKISENDVRSQNRLEYVRVSDVAMSLIYALGGFEHKPDWNWVSM